MQRGLVDDGWLYSWMDGQVGHCSASLVIHMTALALTFPYGKRVVIAVVVVVVVVAVAVAVVVAVSLEMPFVI